MSFNDDYLKLRKKRLEEQQKEQKNTPFVFTSGPYQNATLTEGDIAPVANTKTVKATEAEKKNEESGLFKAGAFSDGYQFGDVTKAILGTAGDAATGIVQGIFGIGEGIADLIGYGVAGVYDLAGDDFHAEQLRETVAENQVEPLFDEFRETTGIADTSLLGDFGYGIAQGVGQVGVVIATGGAGSAAGLGTAGTTALTTGMIGASSMGSGMSEAYQSGATDEEALAYGAMSGVIDAGTELIFGGLGKSVKAIGVSKGVSSLDDVFAKKLSEKMSNQFFKDATEFGVKATGEGLEEVLAGLGSAAAKKLTYMSDEELAQLVEDENLLEQFAAGAIVSGIAQSGDLVRTTKQGRDFITNFSANEETVIEKVYNDRVSKAEQDGTKLTNKEKNELYEQVQEEMRKGYISTDDIESILGGETYKSYKETVDSEDAILKEFEELGKKQNATLADQARYTELQEKVKEIKSNKARDNLKSQLSQTVYDSVKGKDFYLAESYHERARRGTAFEADLSQYDGKTAETVKRAIDSGILNNTRRTHEFVDMVAKISADKGVLFDFTNNAKLKESGFAIDGKFVNGYVTKDGISVNIDSHKSLNSIVGHEISHVLEGTELYAEMQSALFEYAKSKKDYDGRRKTLEELYKNVEGAEIDAELTADLVGDYLFTDEAFINNLSTKHRNVFKKIYDEIKYLLKVATSGSKEARELEKVKRAFDKAYRANSKASGDTKYSISDKNIKDVSTGYAYGESYYTMSYTQDGKVVGTLEYGEYDGEPNVKMVEVDPEYRRKGIGTKLLQELQRKYPDTEIDFGMTTPDGTKLLDAITYDVTDNAIVEGRQKLKDLQTELNELQEKLDVLFDTENLTEAQDKELHELGDRWQEVYETISGLEKDLRGKKATKTFVKTDTKYSLSDSDGKQLTKEQSEYFKDSKMRDENGNLKVMYHGSQDAGFHTFDANMSDDNTSFFFVDRNDVAASYSGTSETYEAQTIRTAEDMNNFIESIGVEDYEVVEKDGKFTLLYEGDRIADSNTAKGIYEEFCWYEGVGEGDANYKVYLNLTNPLVIDAKGGKWNDLRHWSKSAFTKAENVEVRRVDSEFRLFDKTTNAEIANSTVAANSYTESMDRNSLLHLMLDKANYALSINTEHLNTTRDVSIWAKAHGYDGVIFNNIHDNGGFSNGSEGASTVAIAFESNQIKSVANEKPTSNPDIRYSLSNPQTDKDYLAAVERGDMETAQRMVYEAAKQAGYTDDASWKMQHTAPNSKDDVSLYDLKASGLVPDDYWTHPHWYQTTPEENESFWKVKNAIETQESREAKGIQRDATMWVYRAVDKTVNTKEDSFRNGDWVTPSYDYAVNEGRMNPNGYRIIKQRVSIKDLYWDGNSIAELGYDDGNTYAYKDTVNNRKLLDPVTYDDFGKVIPLSKRFKYRNSDVRYSLSKEGETPKRYGNYNIFGEDISLEAPTAEDVAPESEVVAKNAIPTENVAPTDEGLNNLELQHKIVKQKYMEASKANDTEAIRQYSENLIELEEKIAKAEATTTEKAVAPKERKPSKAALANFTKKSKYSGGFSFQGGYAAGGKQYLSDGNFAVEFNDIDESIPHNKDFPIKKLQNSLSEAISGQSTEKYTIDFDKIVEINKANNNNAIVSVGGTLFDGEYIEAVMKAIPDSTFALSNYRGGLKPLVAVGNNGTAMIMPLRAGDNVTVAYEAQEAKSSPDFAPMPSEPTIYDLEQEQSELEDKIRVAMESNDPSAPALIDQYGELLDTIAKRKKEESTMESERLASLDDADAPPEVEAPYYGESTDTAPENPFEDRDIKAVGNRKVNAYMYENPEVKPFFQAEANVMLGELQNTIKGERWYNDEWHYASGGEYGWGGTKRHTTPDIAYLLDVLRFSYADIEKGLNAIIEDNGKENNAASKRIEFLLNDRLINGYRDADLGFEIPPNQDYINLLNEKQISEYSEEARAKFFEEADKYDPLAKNIAPVAENKTANEPIIDKPIEDIAPIAESAPKAEAYEAIKPKKKASSEPRLKRVKEGEQSPDGKERKWIGTSTESEAVDGKILPEDLDQEAIHYQPISNKKTLNTANAKLDKMGYESSVAYFNSQFANKTTTVEDIVLGERLIQEAIKRGDTKTAGELIEDVAILGTELGQKVQALSIIKRLTPEGQLRMLQRTVERGKTRGDKAYEGVEITQEMIDKILKAYGKDGSFDQAKLNEAVEDAKQKIADQMKVSKMDKVNAWRYLSMLGNPKTHIRNLVSNVAMRGTTAVKNVVARTIETVAPIENRTKTWKKASDEVKAFSQKTAAEMQDILSDGGKYNEDASIKQKRAVFKNKILNGVYEFNSDMLSKEDWWFSKPAFTNALSEYLTANGITTAQDIQNNPKIVAKAKQYATEQSQIATFRQYSWLANKINEIEHKNTATQIAVGAVLPFKKTPINIAKTALNYSPLGFAKTLTYDASQVKNGKMEASELVDHLAQNVTGSALVLIGYMLANAGFLNGAGEDDKEGDYDYQLGEQAYSINIGDATFSLSWLSPIAMPLFVGANAYEQLVEGKEWNGDVVVETLAQTLDPLSEMSFLSSLDSVLSSYDSGIEKFAGIAESAGQSYISQFVPTLSSQVAAVMDDTKRSTKVAADSDFKFVDETVNKLKYKIPFLRETLEPSTDIWGNDIKQSENIMERAFETFIAPYAKKADISSDVDDELKELYRETGDAGLIPSIPYNYINYDGAKYEMSANEYTEYKKLYGQNAYELMSALFDTNTYKNASSEERADMVNKVYDFARDEAKKEFFAKYGVEFTNATKEGKEYYKENSIKGAIEYDMTPEEYEFSTENPEKYKFLHDVGVTYEEYENGSEEFKEAYSWAFKNPEKYTMSKAVASDIVTYRKYASDLYDIKADKDEYGKSISGSRKEKVIEYVNNLDIDYGERLILFKSEYNADDTYNYEIIDYLNNRQDISYEEMVTILKELGFVVRSDGTILWD